MRPEQKLISAYASRIVIMKADTHEVRPETGGMRPELVEGQELLADHTTLRVGGPARRMLTLNTEAELIDAVRDLDAAGEPLLILGLSLIHI